MTPPHYPKVGTKYSVYDDTIEVKYAQHGSVVLSRGGKFEVQMPLSQFWTWIEMKGAVELSAALKGPEHADEKWRVGSKVPINVYEGDRPVCQCQTAIDAARIVEAMNGAERLEVALPDKCPVCGDGGCSNCRIDLAQKRIAELEAALKVARQDVESVQPIQPTGEFMCLPPSTRR